MAIKICNTEHFEKLRSEGGYYVDKTGILEKLLAEGIRSGGWPDPAPILRHLNL